MGFTCLVVWCGRGEREECVMEIVGDGVQDLQGGSIRIAIQ